jgi:hypothetical protein
LKSGNAGSYPFARRDFVAALALFLATAGFVLWQNSQIAVLWDLSYLLDTSWRMALGQVPYRDFPLVHAPLTFLVQASIMRVVGRHYLLQIGYAALVGGVGTVLAWRILLSTLRERLHAAWTVSLLLALPLIFLGIYSVYPHPIYDSDCVFVVLLGLWLLQKYGNDGSTEASYISENGAWNGWIRPLLTGAALVLPMFFKQNIGLPFLLAVVGGIALSLMVKRFRREWDAGSTRMLWILLGMGLGLSLACVLLQVTVGLSNYYRWTIQFAAQRRLPGFGMVLAEFREPTLVWMLASAGVGAVLLAMSSTRRFWLQALASCLLSAPLIGSLIFLLCDRELEDRSDNLLALWPLVLIVAALVALFELRRGITLARLLPFVVLAAIQGTLLSQSLDGSTYAIWPLFFILIAQMLAVVPVTRMAGRWFAPALATVVCVTFLICGGLYAAGYERMNYIVIPDEPEAKATLPALRGMADRGSYLAEFEELVRFADKEIPAGDGILILPGEDPFYFATGRSPRFPVLLFDPTTDPYSAAGVLDEARKRDIRWVIVKTHQQSIDDQMPEKDRTLAIVRTEFRLYRKLTDYEVYRR